MKRVSIILALMCVTAVSAGAAKKAAPVKTPTEAEKAAIVVKNFLTLMDEGKFEEGFAFMDFDALIMDQLKLDTAKMTPREKERQIKAYKNVSKSMFISGKKETKFRNFTMGAFKQTGDKATIDIINSPPKGMTGPTTIRSFKVVLKAGAWKIYGINQQVKK